MFKCWPYYLSRSSCHLYSSIVVLPTAQSLIIRAFSFWMGRTICWCRCAQDLPTTQCISIRSLQYGTVGTFHYSLNEQLSFPIIIYICQGTMRACSFICSLWCHSEMIFDLLSSIVYRAGITFLISLSTFKISRYIDIVTPIDSPFSWLSGFWKMFNK